IYPFFGNLQAGTPNVLMYRNDAPVREWYVTHPNGFFIYNTGASFNFWLELLDTYEIVDEVKYLKSRIDKPVPINPEYLEEYDYLNNYPILPKHLFFVDGSTTPLYKKSMFSKFSNEYLPGMMLSSDGYKVDIQEPT